MTPPVDVLAGSLQRARAEFLPAIEAELRAFIDAAAPESRSRLPPAIGTPSPSTRDAQLLPGLNAFYGMMRFALGWVDERLLPASAVPGKRNRPLLCLLSCKAAGGDWHIALPAAAALELLHNFTLVHDDIEDGDEVRHHRSTVWKLWGEPTAINVGDGMHVLAYLALTRLRDHGVPPQRALSAVQFFLETSLRITEGQHLDLEFEGRGEVGVDEYLEMIERKSAAIIRCAAGLGARLAGAGDGAVDALERYGMHLGLAFQIRDDLLDLWGREETRGKPWASDLRRGKMTLPILYGLAAAPADRQRIADVLSGERREEVSIRAAVAELERVGARERATLMVAEHAAAARAALAALPGTSARDALEEHVTEIETREW